MSEIKSLYNLIINNFWKIFGVLFGLFSALLILSFGFLTVVLIIACMAVGYYGGLFFDKKKIIHR